MIKIAVDSYFIRNDFTGVGRYLKNLLENLVPISRNDFYFYIILRDDMELNIKSDNYEKIVLKEFNHYSLWQNIALKGMLKKIDYDVLWSPNYILPLFSRKNSLLTIHDVSWKVLKQDYSLFNRLYRDFMTKRSLKKSRAVFTVSEFTKKELLRYYGFKQDLVFPVYHGIEDKFKSSSNSEINKFREKYNISKQAKLIGYIGSIFKRRNLDVLIKSFLRFNKIDDNSRLFIVGKIFDLRIKELLNNKNIIYLERINEDEIIDFFSSLDLFVYISDYEGFGLPPLEALSCNTIPVLLNKTSLKEVFNDISILIDNADENELFNKISLFFNNKKSIEIEIFERFERLRINVFNWRITADKYYEVLKELYL